MASDAEIVRCAAPWPGAAARLLEGLAALGPGTWRVEQICRAFSYKMPAVVCSHRLNYTSRVSDSIRDKGLTVLAGVLEKVLHKFPEAEFLSSDKLASRILSETCGEE